MRKGRVKSYEDFCSLFFTAENYWQNEFSVVPSCCGDTREIVDEMERERLQKEEELKRVDTVGNLVKGGQQNQNKMFNNFQLNSKGQENDKKNESQFTFGDPESSNNETTINNPISKFSFMSKLSFREMLDEDIKKSMAKKRLVEESVSGDSNLGNFFIKFIILFLICSSIKNLLI
jgi:hypothetical protein